MVGAGTRGYPRSPGVVVRWSSSSFNLLLENGLPVSRVRRVPPSQTLQMPGRSGIPRCAPRTPRRRWRPKRHRPTPLNSCIRNQFKMTRCPPGRGRTEMKTGRHTASEGRGRSMRPSRGNRAAGADTEDEMQFAYCGLAEPRAMAPGGDKSEDSGRGRSGPQRCRRRNPQVERVPGKGVQPVWRNMLVNTDGHEEGGRHGAGLQQEHLQIAAVSQLEPRGKAIVLMAIRTTVTTAVVLTG